MGERKGVNKYYPPDYDPRVGGLNKFLGTHALRERARKIDKGIIIIRFEMPYNIWCEGCKNHIGMGVRYNAEKTKVGMYYTTPVYEFKMKCHLCDNHFVIRADPANLDYVIQSGARRQENRWDPTKNEQIVPETKETQKRLFDDSMYKLEHGSEDKNSADSAKPRLVKLFTRNEDVWADSYSANQMLRAQFRKANYDLKQTASQDQLLLKKSSLDIPLLPEREEDKKVATLLSMKLKPSKSITENTETIRKNIISQSSLPTVNFSRSKEEKAMKILHQGKQELGIVHKRSSSSLTNDGKSNVTENEDVKKCKITSLVGDYGSSESE
ncbi:coiled-coil domain-containing protein 130 homolog [Diorhabda carinulata]|uniref:coiled-coil domain-containing protein 130 homolog n=1 Tax=Diorhabda carinulata TaxID=1163345 RepID=UPI0025A0D2AA|nr:coiled-coil domain-containing protein 130 homolog [Diorhabda carinulata]